MKDPADCRVEMLLIEFRDWMPARYWSRWRGNGWDAADRV